jgi:hypothetical protein
VGRWALPFLSVIADVLGVAEHFHREMFPGPHPALE